jgi:hypothetical protein
MSVMQSAALIFIMAQLQSATSEPPSLIQTRTRWGKPDLFGPLDGRDCHSQWPPAGAFAKPADAVVSAAIAAASVRNDFMLKILD